MHFHLHQLSICLIPSPTSTSATSTPPVPLIEHNPTLTYRANTTIPILTSTIHVPSEPRTRFAIQCTRTGDSSDIGTRDLSFEVFVDNIFVASCFMKFPDARHKVYVTGVSD